MRNAFTLIELLITVSLILLMSVISVPIFNKYAAKNDLKVKAEEIKYFIEDSYASAYSPDIENNGSVVQISTTEIKKMPHSFESSCYKNINKNKCNSITFINNLTNNVTLDNYTFDDLKISGIGSSNVQILILSPAQKENIHFCGLSAAGGSQYQCKPSNTNISFELAKRGTSGLTPIKITIYQDPFRVETK